MAGQIIKRGDRTWLVRMFLGRHPETGKREYHNKTIHGTKKDAEKYLTGVQRERDLGTFTEPTTTTLNEYLNQWLENAAKGSVRERTHADYAKVLDRYIRPALGSRKLHQLTPLDVQHVYKGMQDRGLSSRTVRYAHAVLNRALVQAVKWRLLTSNPASFVDLPKMVRKEMVALGPDEVKRFLEAAQLDPWGVIFELAIVTGMRPGEYLGLQWKDVDFRAEALVVRRALTETPEG
jgi:integrase